MQDYEKLGLFYLGRAIDPASGEPAGGPYLYDSRDLTTHAVAVGMTGSGKTGLCLALLEEAAIDGVPVIALDPKGDVANLLLTFPALDGASFAPWVNADDARRADLSVEAFAAREAERWREGLAAWDQDGTRIERLRRSAEFAVYTPGSTAGTPLSIVRSFAAPPAALREDADLVGERVTGAVSSLLGLAGVEADPLQSREHILLATLVGHAWRQGQDLDLGALIHQIQTPPVTRVGVMELEAFYPARDRFALATRLNTLLASPSFAAWLEGEPLDVGRLLYGPSGRPRVSVVSIAHLADAERMFVVSLLLGEVVAWMRTQPGTSSLRALVYMDEVFGYLPPVANPPSKPAMLTILKQARAFGVGLCLATQNPVDLDYKALANAGTWFIGRLQTERDRARLLDGLDRTAAGIDRAAADATLSGLGKRQFLVHNVHADGPVVIATRWCLSYLRGPFTREDLRRLAPAAADAAAGAPAAPPAAGQPGPPPEGRPLGSLEIPQLHLPVAVTAASAWEPRLYGAASIHYGDARRRLDDTRRVAFLLPLDASTVVVDWDGAAPTSIAPHALEAEPPVTAPYAALPPRALDVKTFTRWAKDFDRWLARTQRLTLLRHAASGLLSAPDESERDFRIRLAGALRETRDAAIDKVRAKYASKLATAAERVRRGEMAVGKEQQDVSQHRVQAGLSTAATIGSVVLGALFGRRAVSQTSIGRASTTARTWARGRKEAEDVERAGENLAAARAQLEELEQQVEREVEAIAAGGDAALDALEPVAVAPKRGGVAVDLVAIVWEARGPN